MPSEHPLPGKCGAKCKAGGYCTQNPIAGFKRCRTHPGIPLAEAKAKGAVRTEVMRWGLGDVRVDPGEMMLRLVSQSAARVELYSRALKEAYDAAGRIQAANEQAALRLLEPETRVRWEGETEIEMPEEAALQVARADLRRIFSAGPIAALIGHKYASTKDGDIFASGEAIRGLVDLENQERDRLLNFCAKARAAGLAEHQVKIAQQQGLEMAGVFRRVLAQLGLTEEQRALIPGLLAREIGQLMAKPENLIEGSAA